MTNSIGAMVGGDDTACRAMAACLGGVLDAVLVLVVLESEGTVLGQDGLSLVIAADGMVGSSTREYSIRSRASQDIRSRARNEAPTCQWSDSERPQSVRAVVQMMPQISCIADILNAVGVIAWLERDGRPVDIDAFRLRNNADWVIRAEDSADHVLAYAAGRCNAACRFCYLRGRPRQSPASSDYVVSSSELRTRIKYFNPELRRALFAVETAYQEPFSSPRFMEALQAVRQKTKGLIAITTNGLCVTASVVDELRRLGPIRISLSLNSISHTVRRHLMQDPDPSTAIEVPKLLAQAGIPFSGSLVGWPGVTDNDMLDTIAYLAENNAQVVTIKLPGHTRFFPKRQGSRYHRVAEWERCCGVVVQARKSLSMPVLPQPYQFFENVMYREKGRAVIEGIVARSAAASAGCLLGDVITSINGTPVLSRSHARDMIANAAKRKIHLSIERGSGSRELVMNCHEGALDADDALTWVGSPLDRTGLLLPGWLRLSYFVELAYLINLWRARHAVLATTELMMPSVRQELRRCAGLFATADLVPIVPKHRYWGGNIVVGALHVTGDFVAALEEYQKSKQRPDLFIVPSSPWDYGGEWKLDYAGRPYEDIERQTRVRTRLIKCDRIMD